MSAVDANFGDITLEYDIDITSKLKLASGLEIEKDKIILPQTYTFAYQELLLQQALDAHFEKEKENFYRKNAGVNPPRIKTNSLFFIDSISSFRGDGENKGWLRISFENLLTAKLKKEITTADGTYKEFLEASLCDVSKTIAGYFAEDNAKKGDEAIQSEIDDILRNKENMFRFKNEDGTWNVRRFLFSKWTLREGWDNPNVFVIAKLRTSGSEISKIQEVGRGLRLPFDETSTRISPQNSSEDFRLTYIIDYSERTFAQKLVGEINSDGAHIVDNKINDGILEALVKAGYAINAAKAKGKLLLDDVIDEHEAILDTEKLFALIPEDSPQKVKTGAITGEGMPKRPMVHINQDNAKKLKELWEKVTRRYVLHFTPLANDTLKAALECVFSDDAIFVNPTVEIHGQTTSREDGRVGLEADGYKNMETLLATIPYGEFLRRLNSRTSLPVPLLHSNIIAARKGKETPPKLFNMVTLENVIKSFEKTFSAVFKQSFTYQELAFNAKTSLFTDDGGFVSELSSGLVGSQKRGGVPIVKEKYLYTDEYVFYDSEIELDVLKVKPPARVIVYGKLPKSSIKVPTYTGGTTSPDFVYAIQKQGNENIDLHLIVETKSDNKRESDTKAIEAQRAFFELLGGNITYKEITAISDLASSLKVLADNGG
jgi:type III restriction enzyme